MDKIIRLIKLPPTIHGMTVTDSDGNYNIYINCNLTVEMQVSTYLHESNHIDRGDFESNDQVHVLENTDKYACQRRKHNG